MHLVSSLFCVQLWRSSQNRTNRINTNNLWGKGGNGRIEEGKGGEDRGGEGRGEEIEDYH